MSKDLKKTGRRKTVALETLKYEYLTENLSVKDIATKHRIKTDTVRLIIRDNQLDVVKKSMLSYGLMKIKNKQLSQAEQLMNIDCEFRQIRIGQLQGRLQEFKDHHEKHGDFYVRNPENNEILIDVNGFKVSFPVNNVIQEIQEMKESISLSVGLEELLHKIDDIIHNTHHDAKYIDSPQKDDIVVEGENFKDLFDEAVPEIPVDDD